MDEDEQTNAFSDAAERVAGGSDHHAEAAALVTAMTLDERLGCLDGDLPFWPGVTDMATGGYTSHAWPAARVERLGIPGLHFADGPRGCVAGPSTAFPVSMARGAAFDPDLERRIGDAIGAELRSAGATYTGAVCMNLLRHPAWGRAQETYGEDPHHVGEIAAAFTEGLQQHVMACMKHFALNSMENARFTVDVTADERALHEVYLPHFKRVAAADVASVMSAYNSVNGEWCGENPALLTEVLRDEWNWDGYVTSDFIYGLRDPAKSVQAGLNIEMPFRQQRAVALADAVDDGRLSVTDIDERVTETVATFLRFAHVFAEPTGGDVRAAPEHRALARETATASMVLLRNEGELLPVAADALTAVAVLGRLAALPNLGDGGSSNVLAPEVVTPLDGLRAALPHAEVIHADTDPSISDGADLTIVVVGYTKDDEGEYLGTDKNDLMSLFPPMDHPLVGFPPPEETAATAPAASETTTAPSEQALGHAVGGDRASLELHEEDVLLIQEAAARSDRVVVAVMSGSAVVMPWLDQVPAALMIWYPGMEGGHALADVLFGAAEPGGRLPFAVPHEADDLVEFDRDATAVTYGLFHGQWHLDHEGTQAHLPFGFGLGYTTWTLDDAVTVDGDRSSVRATVTNAGTRPGSTVVQVYGAVPDSDHLRPPRRLIGFRRVSAEPGQSLDVEIRLDLDQLRVRDNGTWITEDAPIHLMVGFHAGDESAVAILP
jgi:beta-glucosidase